MSYAIIRNEKLTRAQAMGAYKHNERKTKNHSNKNIDSSKTELNYYLKKNELSYIKEFDRIKEKYDLKGQIRNNSNIKNMPNYLMICLYNNLGNSNVLAKTIKVKNETTREYERKYPDGFFDSLYANFSYENAIASS